MNFGEIEKAEDTYQDMYNTATKIGDVYWRAVAKVSMAEVQEKYTGEYSEAEKNIKTALELFQNGAYDFEYAICFPPHQRQPREGHP